MRAKVCFGWKTDILPGFLKASDDAVDTPSQCNSAASDNREPFNQRSQYSIAVRSSVSANQASTRKDYYQQEK